MVGIEDHIVVCHMTNCIHLNFILIKFYTLCPINHLLSEDKTLQTCNPMIGIQRMVIIQYAHYKTNIFKEIS